LLDDSPFKAEVEKYPNFLKWHESLSAHPSIRKAFDIRAQLPS